MPSDPRFVFDTNVIVSALLLKRSLARQALDLALQIGDVLISQETLLELHTVLRRKGFQKYVTEEERTAFLVAFVREGRVVDITHTVQVCRDPKDDKFLALALSGNATCIVSGDKDLLVLHPFRGVQILTPRQFLEKWRPHAL